MECWNDRLPDALLNFCKWKQSVCSFKDNRGNIANNDDDENSKVILKEQSGSVLPFLDVSHLYAAHCSPFKMKNNREN